MNIISTQFFVFFLIFSFCYFTIPGKNQWILLLIISIFFYIQAGIVAFIVLGYACLLNFFGAVILAKLAQKHKDTDDSITKNRRMLVLFLVLFGNLAALVLFKYHQEIKLFLAKIFPVLYTETIQPTKSNIALPLGISFYTFQAMGYVIDVYRGAYNPQTNFAKFALFISYFPTVSQGPIERYDEIFPQMISPKSFDYNQALFGLQRIIWGCLKKLVIAERLALLVNNVYGNWADYAGVDFIVATMLYAFQLYTDFSGFMDIIIGISQILGIKLNENFQTPFFSTSIAEFWRRWHITLGSWFRDYLYYPLLKSRLMQKISTSIKKRINKTFAKNTINFFALFILWLTIGIWHEASFKFIIGVGLLNCVYLISGQIFSPVFKKTIAFLKINTKSFFWHLFQTLRTFFLICICLVFFRAPDFSTALQILKRVFSISNYNNFSLNIFLRSNLSNSGYVLLFASLLLLLCISLLQYKKIDIRKTLLDKSIFLSWGICFLAILFIFACGVLGSNEFIYFQF